MTVPQLWGRPRGWPARAAVIGCLLGVVLAGAGWRQATIRRALDVTTTAHERALHRARQEARARQGRERERAEAVRASELAGLLVDHVSLMRRHLPLAPADRAAHGRARMVIFEARFLLADGIHARSVARAAEARDLAAGAWVAATDLIRRYDDPIALGQWQAWIREAIGMSGQTGGTAVVVSKAAHRVTVYAGGQAVRTYPGDLGVNWVLDKTRAGDGATPEGRYRVTEIRHRGSAYYKALPLDYPNDLDRRAFAAAQRTGRLPATASIGGAIAIHGHGGRGRDWTDGCVALSDRDLDDLITRVAPGTLVVIVGASRAGEMTERLAAWGTPALPARAVEE